MTEESNITITMQDVEVVRQINPEFNKELVVAAVARSRAEQECCGAEEVCCRTEEGKE